MMCHAEFLLAASNDYAAQESIVEVAARMVDRIVRRNDASRGLLSNQDAPNASSLFESSKKCPLSPPAYLRRILKYTACSTSTIPVGLVYLQRLRNALADTGALSLTSFNIQRLLLTAIMLASKYLDEPTVNNKQWGLVGDMSVQEMNELELDMLWKLKFSLNVTREEYDECFCLLTAMDAVDRPSIQPSSTELTMWLDKTGDRSLNRLDLTPRNKDDPRLLWSWHALKVVAEDETSPLLPGSDTGCSSDSARSSPSSSSSWQASSPQARHPGSFGHPSPWLREHAAAQPLSINT